METKRIFLHLATTALIFCLISVTTHAQELSFGPKVGYSATGLAGNDVPDDTRYVSNFAAGMFFKANAGDIVSIQPEILYHQKGATTSPEGDPDGLTLDVNYLEIPVLVKVQIPVAETVYPFVYAGPYGAFELDNTFTGTAFDGLFSVQDEADVNDFDYGAVVGLGMDFQMDAIYFGVDARYGIGMSKILKIDGEQQDMKNRNVSVFASLGVNL